MRRRRVVPCRAVEQGTSNLAYRLNRRIRGKRRGPGGEGLFGLPGFTKSGK